MTAAIISLALALAGGIAAIAWLAHRLEAALGGQVDAQRLFTDEKRVAEEYLAQRDAKEVRVSELMSLNAALKQRITMLELERNRAYDQAVKDVGDKIRGSGVADAAAVFERLLGAPLPGVSAAAQAGAGGHDGAGTAAVQPAVAPPAGGAGRGPGA